MAMGGSPLTLASGSQSPLQARASGGDRSAADSLYASAIAPRGRWQLLPRPAVQRLGYSPWLRPGGGQVRRDPRQQQIISEAVGLGSEANLVQQEVADLRQELEKLASPTPRPGEVEEVHSAEELDSILQQSSGLVLLEVVSTWCHMCRSFAPKYKRMAAEYTGKVRFLKVTGNENASTNTLVMERLKVRETPAFYFFQDGEVVSQQKGGKAEEL